MTNSDLFAWLVILLLGIFVYGSRQAAKQTRARPNRGPRKPKPSNEQPKAESDQIKT